MDIGVLAYNKPAAVLVMLREEILGPEVFDEGFREYIRRWAYKHPQPADFIRTMEGVMPDVNRGNNVWGRGIIGRTPPR